MSIKRLFLLLVIFSTAVLFLFTYFSYQTSKDLLFQKMELSSKINVLSIRSQDEAQKGHPDIAQKWESELEALRFKMSAFLTLSLSMLVFSLAIAYIRIIKPLAELKSKMEKGENCAPPKLICKDDEIATTIQIYNGLLDSLKASAAKNKELLDNFKTFTSNSIHQVRTPIAVIKISQQMLGEESKEIKEQISSSVTLMEHIYDNLAYQAQRDYVEFLKDMLDISAILRERIKMFSIVAAVNDKEIIADIEDHIWFDINKTEIEYLIDNNISNAIKYGKQRAPIYIKLWLDGTEIVMSFANEGRPIKNKTAIFERFERESEGKQGHGIGLHIVKEITEKYRIKI
ncbi:MAG TPA: HAMP domain-containing sensor histidine kinase, partial [Campylobacterales bacterium]|nr:HAMP domain-containing sensor histidine kinase [Campylobacterales bacterium]